MASELDLPRHPQMDLRRCGFSGLHVSAIAVGMPCNIHNKSEFGYQRAMVHRALDLGITHFDFPASWSGRIGVPGKQTQGTLASLRQHRDDVVLAAHIGFGARRRRSVGFGSRKDLVSALNVILRGLSLDYVDILYSDRYDPNTPLEETMEALSSAVTQGKALYVGLSGYAPAMARRAIEILYKLGNPPIVCQAPFSMVNPWAEDALLDILDSYSVSFVADNPLASGALDASTQLSGNHRHSQWASQSGLGSAAEVLAMIADTRSQNISQLALSWVLRNRRVSSAIITPETPRQLDDLSASAAHTSFTAGELEAINELITATYQGHPRLLHRKF
ncbi:aldo/keto reductase [Streptomyces sp. NPDC093982]|uniref:aldo/keto reductase n=1 Tax=Streptomyces sp. NPDC093982 TaxID=3155077 RepID=UPI00342CA9F7